MLPLPCCAFKRNHFDDDDELFIFVQKDMHSKTYKGLIIYLQTQNYKTITYLQTLKCYNTLQRMAMSVQ